MIQFEKGSEYIMKKYKFLTVFVYFIALLSIGYYLNSTNTRAASYSFKYNSDGVYSNTSTADFTASDRSCATTFSTQAKIYENMTKCKFQSVIIRNGLTGGTSYTKYESSFYCKMNCTGFDPRYIYHNYYEYHYYIQG